MAKINPPKDSAKAGSLEDGDLMTPESLIQNHAPAREVAVAVKPQGQADPGPTYAQLYTWAHKNGYMAVGGCCERFLGNSMQGNYARMKSEIMVPVKKVDFKSAHPGR